MNALEDRMLVLLADKMRARPEIAADLKWVEQRLKADRQSQEEWIQLAEKLSQPADTAGQREGGD